MDAKHRSILFRPVAVPNRGPRHIGDPVDHDFSDQLDALELARVANSWSS